MNLQPQPMQFAATTPKHRMPRLRAWTCALLMVGLFSAPFAGQLGFAIAL